MSFAEFRRGVRLVGNHIDVVGWDSIYCQYNPDWMHTWNVLAGGSWMIKDSPHVKALRSWFHDEGSVQPYVDMQVAYTHSMERAKARLSELFALFEDIEKNGLKSTPVVLSMPLCKTKVKGQKDYFEIWEGHHRLACMYVLGMDANVEVCKWTL